jgi:hypothetical protein
LAKLLFYIALLLLPFTNWSQTPNGGKSDGKLRKKWKEIHENHGFRKAEDYQGPNSDPYVSPSEIDEDEYITPGTSSSRNTPYSGIPYSSSRQQQGRNPHGPGGGGSIDDDPDITEPDDIDIPDIDAPDIDAPDINIDTPSAGGGFWTVLLIILGILVVALIAYYIIKNRQPGNSTIPFEPLEEDLNPATISKTELELRLEEAIARGDYKECVRIYFLFVMKDLIDRRWVFWKREKTNIHYLIEMTGRPGAKEFEEVVNIYDLVWYGDYEIDAEAYKAMEPKLDSNYKFIQSLR